MGVFGNGKMRRVVIPVIAVVVTVVIIAAVIIIFTDIPEFISFQQAWNRLKADGYTAYTTPSGDFVVPDGDLYTGNINPSDNSSNDIGSDMARPSIIYHNCSAG
jgi:hypothetical protein